MIRLILTIMLSALAFASMGANDCGASYQADIDHSLCNLIRGDYSLHESIFRTPDKVGNLYREAECKGRRYDRGGRLLWDGEYHYSYDCEGNLVRKSRRDINAKTAENGQAGDAGGKNKAGWFRLLFGPDGTGKDDRRETNNNGTADPFMDWEPGDTCYCWHANGMLAEVRTSDGKVVSFGYDALGRRVSKRTGDALHRFGWDGNVVLHEWDTEADRMPRLVKDETSREEYDDTEKPENLVTWVYDGTSFTPVAKVTAHERYTIVHDYLGTPTQAYDSKGELVWEMLLDVYGGVMECRGDRTLVPFRYQGQYEDAETGLYYNRFRYYSPQMGMYISSDPIGLAGNNPTLYGYVQDVNTWLDAFGLMPKWMKTRQGYQRHHIIPQSLKEHPVIQISGINIDGAANMKYLPVAEGIDTNPNKAIHLGWNEEHAQYNRIMRQKLDDIYDRSKMEGWSHDSIRMQREVNALQRNTRQGLDSGKIKCH